MQTSSNLETTTPTERWFCDKCNQFGFGKFGKRVNCNCPISENGVPLSLKIRNVIRTHTPSTLKSSNDTNCNTQPLNDYEYASSFEVFVNRSSEYEAMISWMCQFINKWQNETILKPCIFSIGAGTGHFDSIILDYICNNFVSPRYYCAFEPNPIHYEELNKRINKYSFSSDVIREYFTPRTHRSQKFDLILMSHCLYPMPDPLGAIKNAISMLNKNGVLIIFHQTKTGMCEAVNKINNEYLKWNLIPTADHSYSIDDIVRELKNIHIPFNIQIETEESSSYIDFTDIGKNDIITDEMLSFFIQTKASNLDPKIRANILNQLTQNLVEKDGKLLYEHPTGIILIKHILKN